ncbi:BTB/POZ protein [Rhizophagus irregularis DAOM 181602=DAOM 197198]|uniref:BTB/POZ protein n=1 Tax=Rhizophagus irregularis (strain DAOM 181602 / DAOM 197198 / MUCL 43194) TaxID=747089 RepID=A0A2P4QTP1_RHIID|nr:BTB/POZ protein [Rhizophagus irregularis DAOM 181602=DAOM 197198]POG81001.1 BTB/POZ protein [Rhizophagus irregularis DAOM 181602=DAOM 197198]|eukprot:XP_025187867.1 BTB/POZ protein [Rhizophagus irregularis DAOM 181602=DAOM 197198]
MDDNKFLPKLSQNLLELLDDDEFYDVTIEVGSDPYVKIFRAHMNILNYRSPYFRKILSDKNKSHGTLTHIKLSDVLPEIFQIILRYIYGGKLFSDEYTNFSVFFKTLVAASEFDLQELIRYSIQIIFLRFRKIF